jgi:hypothetical protein
LNACPASSLNNCKFPTKCTTRNVQRKMPVRAITSFFPNEDENVFAKLLITLYYFIIQGVNLPIYEKNHAVIRQGD